MASILFICTGNTCRSPMAVAFANALFKSDGLPHIAVSRGINVVVPSRAEENAILAAKLIYKADLSGHVSRQLQASDMDAHDIVLTMTRSHKDYLLFCYADHADKVSTLSEYCGAAGDVEDPFGGDLAVYKACAQQIKGLIDKAFREGTQ